ncbi:MULTISPECIES: aldehyde dehydrogenase family protein [Pseudomonadota]|uniref:aldehyde dehydrogenase family protein n=1 Tax=Pseudomonadota TaxID=1224 RepID=UPI00066E3F4E|nr:MULTISPECIES: aldehyde dehydrogenase family protein [Pseudomonadota]AKQ17211.1 aldehyde dehydrogenase [Pseudomonas aeruginosa]CUI67485.1 Putative aldehyde dehydrogenase SA1924 [Achromobacter xylosoxidans]CUJ52161.1 Putative aldehyde dehydrogenase SA1924 [Achromobacter xylosoxidans]GLE94944.1 aldehyde dehydrogenase [Pseudomonas aeruginosa]GLF04524.1 aldehyde dehydrogenase [Pseudomonas aeruginosa]
MHILNQHFINGSFVSSHGQETVDVHNPATGELIGRATLGDEEDTRLAIAAAKAAFPAWSKTTLEERKDYLQRIADALTERLDDLNAMTVAEFGVLSAFVGYGSAQARDFFIYAQDLLKPEIFVEKQGNAVIERLPVGVAGLLSPWNGSAWFVAAKLAPALAAGCTVVIKPSELCPFESKILMEVFEKADLPAGVINLINGRGDVVGDTITSSPDVRKISFTGSTRVGRHIMNIASETMKRVTLELGGKSPTIILDDADLEKAVQFALTVGLVNTGQACIAGTRILVPETRLEEFKAAFKAAVPTLKIGNPAESDTVIQPMISKGHFDRVQGYIRKGIEEGAEVLVGGEGKPEGFEAGNYVKPTIFAGVTNDMTIAQEEIFGPVLSIITYRDEEHAIEIANDVQYGLLGYVASEDKQRARRVASRILSGRVMINELVDAPTMPFGGFKMSGIGREFGLAGLQAYLETRVILTGTSDGEAA